MCFEVEFPSWVSELAPKNDSLPSDHIFGSDHKMAKNRSLSVHEQQMRLDIFLHTDCS